MKTKEPNFRSYRRAYEYAYKNKRRLNLRNERFISKNSDYSYYYALEILKGRFELGEDIISKEAEMSYDYAFFVLDSRFELGEESISKDPEYSALYAKDVIKGRFELGEKAIAKNDISSCIYIENVFGFSVPLYFLELCCVEVLDYLLKYYSDDIKNKDDVIKILFKKKLLERE